MEDKKLSTIDRLQGADPRYIYLLFVLIVGGLMAFPVNIPTPVTQPTIDAYNYIKTIEPGSKVLFCQTYPAGAKAEQLPQATVLAKALIDQGCILIGKSNDLIIAILGILKAGGAYLPIDIVAFV